MISVFKSFLSERRQGNTNASQISPFESQANDSYTVEVRSSDPFRFIPLSAKGIDVISICPKPSNKQTSIARLMFLIYL